MKFQESVLPASIALTILTIIFSIAGIMSFRYFFCELKNDLPKVIFISYLCLYASMWLIYFSSKNKHPKLQISTLRRLLLLESKIWSNIDSVQDDKIEEKSMEKAKTSITAIAMLVGVSFLGIAQAKSGLLWLDTSSLVKDTEEYLWQKYIFLSLGFISTIALVCFVISADALDCMFNEFKTDKLDNKFRRYFYKSTIYPKYIGFVCLLTSIIFLNASSSVTLGSLTVAIIVSIGYRHWFPRSNLTSESWDERSGVPGFWIRFVPLLSIPIITNYL